MKNTKIFAEEELYILSKSSTDLEDRPLVEPFIQEIIALCDKFGSSGQSGGSAPYTAKAISNTIEKLCLQKPISPITGIEEEWVDVSHTSDRREKNNIMYQNRRCSALFKNTNGKVWYLDAISWNEQRGCQWNGIAKLPNGEEIHSHQFVRRFPFEPKTFVIDVISKDLGKDKCEFHIKDERQLEEAFQYYESPWRRQVLVEKS